MTNLKSWLCLVAGAAIGCGLMTNVPTAHAQGDGRDPSLTGAERGCSNATLRGAFAFDVDGAFLGAPAPLLLKGVAMTRFDGRGNLTQVDHIVFNGTPPPEDWTAATGWYRLNADCTGEMEIDIPGSPFSPVILRLSVGANGTHINTVVSKPGYAVSSTGTKVNQN
jgi:hypothetical protein